MEEKRKKFNANSWKGCLQYLGDTAADFCLALETRLGSADAVKSAGSAARARKWRATNSVACKGPTGRALGGTAVCCRSFYGLAAVDDLDIPQEHAHRIKVAKANGVVAGGFYAKCQLMMYILRDLH